MSSIRVSVTPQINKILTFLEGRYPTLSEAEILKLGLAELYHKNTSPTNVKPLAKQGRKAFQKWLEEKNIDINTLSEEEAYEIIAKT